MKEYKLKRWYPSIDPRWEIYHIYEYQPSSGYMCNKSIQHCVVMQKKELHPDFWELIEEEKPKPLFITEDGVEVYDQEDVYYVTDKLEKINSFINWFTIESMAKDTKIFKHESSADKYIEDHKPKPLFVTDDGVEVFLGHSYILIDKEFIKHKQTASNIVYTKYFKKFKHESSADEYIWRNKRVFSYEDMMKAKHSIILTDEDIEKAAIERSKR